MLASVARCLIFFFRCQRCVCLCKVSKLFNVGHQITLKTPVWTDQNICRWNLTHHLPVCSLCFKGCLCMYWSGLPIWDIFLPRPLTRSTWQISLSYSPGSDVNCSKKFSLNPSLLNMSVTPFPLLPQCSAHTCCIYSAGMLLFACLSPLLAYGPFESRAVSLSLISITQIPAMRWQVFMTTGERRNCWYTKQGG